MCLICRKENLEGLVSINLENCQEVRELPPLPASLQRLFCNYTQITSLPSLPASLQTLSCYDTPITFLPSLPASLRYLNCSYTQLSILPSLPASLRYLDCSHTWILTLHFALQNADQRLYPPPNCRVVSWNNPFLNYNNSKYNSNVRKLLRIQKWLALRSFKRKLNRINILKKYLPVVLTRIIISL